MRHRFPKAGVGNLCRIVPGHARGRPPIADAGAAGSGRAVARVADASGACHNVAMARRPVYVAGLGALNIDLVETGNHDEARPPGGDFECVVNDREIERRLASSRRGHEAFLGGSAFNAISMLAQLGGDAGRLGAAAVAAFVQRIRAANPALILSFDPGEPWAEPSRLEPLRYLYRAADIVFLNAREFELLARDSGTAGTIGCSLRRLCRDGATIVIKQLAQILIQASAGYELVRVARPDTRLAVVDPTGAGDAIGQGADQCRQVRGSVRQVQRLEPVEHHAKPGNVSLRPEDLVKPRLVDGPAKLAGPLGQRLPERHAVGDRPAGRALHEVVGSLP